MCRTTTSGAVPLAFLLLAALFLATCSDGGSPTEPGPPPAPAGTALVNGQVTGMSGGKAAEEVSGITVRVRGTGLSALTDGQGRFGLGGVPAGDRVLDFERQGQIAALGLPAVQPQEQIELLVSISGSTVTVESMHRSAAPPAGEPDAAVDLALSLQPDTWNTNWPGSSGTVSAKIEGPGFDRIDLDSIVLVGSDPLAPPLAPTRVDRAGNHVRAFFAKADAFATLDDPQPGEVHTVTLRLTVEGEPVELAGTVRIVGPEPAGGAAIDLEKSTNGEDADAPPGPTVAVGDPVAWEYEVTNTGEVPLSAISVTDDQGVAVSCPASELAPGESMTCTAGGTAVAGQYANLGTASGQPPEGDPVADDDPSHYFGEEEDAEEEADLELDIQPGSWNTNWPGSSGTVSARIEGAGFDRIDLDSIVLVGSDPLAAPLAPTRVDRAGNHVRAFFAKADAFATLDDPQPGEVHTVRVRLTVDGGEMELADEVRIVGPGS